MTGQLSICTCDYFFKWQERKKVHMQIYSFQLSPWLQFIFDSHSKAFPLKSRSARFERPQESRPVLLDVQAVPNPQPRLSSAAAPAGRAQLPATPCSSLSELPLFTLGLESPPPLKILLSFQDPEGMTPLLGGNSWQPWRLELSAPAAFSLYLAFGTFHTKACILVTCQPLPPGTNSSRARTCLIHLCEGVPQAPGEFFSMGTAR